jgi:hypothetical protein
MSNDPVNTFAARITKAKKEHKCLGCLRPIIPGVVYISYPGMTSEGKFMTNRLCIECSFLITQKNVNRNHIREGEFTDQYIPNCLRKKREEFRKDPQAAIKAAGLDKETPPAPPKTIKNIVVKNHEFHRKIFHFPKGKYKVENFPVGGSLTIRAGVKGKSRTVKIIKTCSTSGESFGCTQKQIAILVA